MKRLSLATSVLMLAALIVIPTVVKPMAAARSTTLEARVAALEARVTALEAAWQTSATSSPTTTAAPTPSPTPVPAPTPAASATPTPTLSPTPQPSVTSSPSPAPTSAPTTTPVATPAPTSSSCGVANLASAIANATSGSTVWLSGTYSVGTPITTTKSLTIAACPGGATITGPDTVRPDYLYFKGGPNVVRGVTFRASGCALSSCHDSNGSALLECDGCHDLLVEDVAFVGDAVLDDHQQLFYQRLGRNVVCRRCDFRANGSDGFGFHQYPGSTTDPQTVVEDSSFSGFGTLGAGVTTDSRITVRGSSFRDSYRAIQLRNSASGSVLEDNIDLGGVTQRVQNPSLAVVNTWR